MKLKAEREIEAEKVALRTRQDRDESRQQAGLDAAGGVLVLDKPEGMSSAGITARVKSLLKPRKIGHTGTLDPFATGVLVLCINEATRIADQLINLSKVYVATLHFGVETDTLDNTGKVVRTSAERFSRDELLEALESFRGRFVQKTPRFSAVKVGGRRLYELTRKGIDVACPEREVCIHTMSLRSFDWPEAVLEVRCSKGTYIRQLASDVGQMLGSGAHLSALRRTSVGPYHIDRGVSIDDLAEKRRDLAAEMMVPLNEVVSHLPFVVAEEEGFLARLKCGQLDSEWEKRYALSFTGSEGPVRIVTGSNRLAALWWPNPGSAGSRRLRVFTF